jgi:hypothetical protein
MLINSRYDLQGNTPTTCCFCGMSFPVVDQKIENAWRAADGRLYCSEFCADDAEEAAFQRRYRRLGNRVYV